jgi:hypothetical protein
MNPSRTKRKYFTASLVALVAVAALLLGVALQAGAADISGRTMVGVPFYGSRGVMRTTQDVMYEQATHNSGSPGNPFIGNDHPEFEKSPTGAPNPAALKAASIPPMPADQLVYRPKGLPNQVLSPQTVALNFTGATLSGTNPTSAYPPDCDGAVGPTQYIIAVNGRIVTFNKTTGVADGVLNATTNTFFTSIRNASGTSDPLCRYDRLTGRWFVGMINTSSSNRFLLAVSDAASNGVISASTVWTYYYFIPSTISPTLGSGILSDYPTMGIDANALYVGFDQFVNSSGAFQQVDACVIQKSSVLSGGPIVVTAFRNLMSAGTGYVGPFAPRGVDGLDANQTEGYMIGSDGNSWGNMWLLRFANPGSATPTMTSAMYATPLAEDGPRFVNHLGNTTGWYGGLDPLDDRYFQATIRGQQLWTVHNLGVDNTGVSQGTYAADARDGARWFQINVPVNSGAPTFVQSGTVFTASASNDSLQRNYFIPSVNVNGQGHAAMGFSTAGSSERANCGVVGRLATDPLGTMQTPVLLTSSSTAYNPSDGTGSTAGRPHRWGDYSATMVDPLDDQSMWTVQMWCNGANSYACQIAKLTGPPPATPSAMAPVPVGVVSYAVTLTGVSASGSGFFDPGANLASPARPFNHLSAAVTVGAATGTPPTVVSATYVNPTTVNLVLNTSVATANLPGQYYTITVTNPDGQAAAAAIVQAVNPSVNASAGVNGSISPSGTVTVPYGSNQTFTITADPCYSVGDVQVDGSSVGAVLSYTFTNVQGPHTITATFVVGLNRAATAVAATQVKSGNGPAGTTGITVAFAPPAGAATIEVYRKGFGNYPEYDKGGSPGSVPAPPSAYANLAAEGWTLVTGVTVSGQADSPPSRDDWYYVVYGIDACSNVSPVSAMTGGTLNYHLGDVSDGVTPGAGDNTVNTVDASLLGAHYGATGASLVGFEYLDVGPTVDNTVNGRPAVDGIVEFEDLVMFAINWAPNVSIVAGPSPSPLHAKPVGSNATDWLTVNDPATVNAGDLFDVPVVLNGSGDLIALSVTLGWNPAVVKPVGVSAGDLITSLGGMVLSPGPGRADAALLGAAQGISGQGNVAMVQFQAIAAGAPRISIAQVLGRNAANQDVAVGIQNPLAVDNSIVNVTHLSPVIPNPVRNVAELGFSLAKRGSASLAIYSVDGRLVKSLARGVQEPGNYRLTWNGTEEHGAVAKSGVYFVRFEAAGVRQSRLFTIVR